MTIEEQIKAKLCTIDSEIKSLAATLALHAQNLQSEINAGCAQIIQHRTSTSGLDSMGANTAMISSFRFAEAKLKSILEIQAKIGLLAETSVLLRGLVK